MEAQTQIEEKEVNKLGLTIDAYICPKCGTIHATWFVKSKKLVRCRRCQHRFA